MMAKMAKYLKFMPFLSLPITVFFPSGLALYWCIMANLQLILTFAFRSDAFKRFLGLPKYLPGTILEKIVSL
jgi:membrane protein insertase Oxa1/YidC/SpoIIIJ